MTEKLRTALQEAAEQSRPVQIPDTLWADARRARRRDQIAVTVLAAVLFVGVGAGVSWLVQPRREAVPSDGGGTGTGIPSHVYAASSVRWTALAYTGKPGLSERLDVGKAAVLLPITHPEAGSDEQAQVVLVRAEDGAYVRTTLPGTPPKLDDDSMPRLSPSGQYVAWPANPPGSGAGIRLLDLTTGKFTDHRVIGTANEVTDIVWSHSSGWLGFRTAGPAGAGAGTFELKTGSMHAGAGQGGTAGSLGIGDSGTLRSVDGGALRSWEPGAPVLKMTLPSDATPGDGVAVSDAGIALGGTDGITVGQRPRESFVPIPLEGRGKVVPLRWLDDDHLLVSSAASPGKMPAELGVVTLSKATYKKVGQVDSPVPDQVSYAVALATVDHPTVGRAEPRWVDHGGWNWGRTVMVFLVLGAIAFGFGTMGGRVSRRGKMGHHTAAAQTEAAIRSGTGGMFGGTRL